MRAHISAQVLQKIKAIHKSTDLLDFPKASTAEINRTKKSLNPKKAIRPNGTPLKVIKIAAN